MVSSSAETTALPVAGAALEVRGVSVAYPRSSELALRDVTLDIPRGALVAVMGPNGSGKSTLLKLALGLVTPVEGSVAVLGGQAPRSARPRIGYVPQTELVDWRFPVTVFDVALMGRYGQLGLFRPPRQADRDAARDALERVGMLGLARRQIGELSGGQQQRVFLARALASRPELLLLDEPMSGVDALTEGEIFQLLETLRDRGTTVVMTTHDLSTVGDRFDRVLLLNRTVVAYGRAHEVFTEEQLQRAFGGNLMVVKLGDRWLAVEASAHVVHTYAGPERKAMRGP